MRRPFALLAIGAVLLAASPARAAGNEACFAAALEGQRLRGAGKLLASRKELIECAAPSCPREVARDCARWLAEVSSATPSLVFGLRDASGADVVGARIALDDKDAGTTSDGVPIPVDPGPHKVQFLRDGAAPVERTFVARAGEKNRTFLVQLEAAPAAPVSPAAPAAEPVRGGVPTASIVLGAAGAVALGVFGYFGARGLGDRSRLHCDAGCPRAAKDDVDTKFLVADVALVVSVVALAGAAYVYFARDRKIWK